MKTKVLFLGLAIAPLLYACTPTSKEQTSTNPTTNQDSVKYELIGKKLLLDYGSMQANVDYLTEQTLHWEIKLEDGTLTQGDERINYQRISPSTFFVSWVEADGTSVSQVLDLNNKSVKAYLTMSADSTAQDVRGGRISQSIEGTISERP